MDRSDLNYALFIRFLSERPDCQCGYTAETPEHYYIAPCIPETPEHYYIAPCTPFRDKVGSPLKQKLI